MQRSKASADSADFVRRSQGQTVLIEQLGDDSTLITLNGVDADRISFILIWLRMGDAGKVF